MGHIKQDLSFHVDCAADDKLGVFCVCIFLSENSQFGFHSIHTKENFKPYFQERSTREAMGIKGPSRY